MRKQMVFGARMADILLLLTTTDTTYLPRSFTECFTGRKSLSTRGFAHAWTRHSVLTCQLVLNQNCFTDCNELVSKSNRRDKSSHKDYSFLLVLLSKLFWIVTEQRILFKAHHVWIGLCPEHRGYRARGYDRELVLPNFRDFQYFQANETIKYSCQTNGSQLPCMTAHHKNVSKWLFELLHKVL